MLRLAVLVSGSGSNLQSIIDSYENNTLGNVRPVLAVADRKCFALERAGKHGMKTVLLDRKIYGKKLSEKLNSVLENYNIDFAVLAGWLSILDSDFVKKWEGKVLNIHPSLLPDFGGAGMYGLKVHRAVIDAGRKESGCSVHIVTEEIDGGKVLGRRKVPVFPDDTPEELAARVLKEEHVLYPDVIGKWADSSELKRREN